MVYYVKDLGGAPESAVRERVALDFVVEGGVGSGGGNSWCIFSTRLWERDGGKDAHGH